jgi:hypothetical protein
LQYRRSRRQKGAVVVLAAGIVEKKQKTFSFRVSLLMGQSLEI